MKRTIKQIICYLCFDGTPDEAIAELTEAKKKCVGFESCVVQIRGDGSGDGDYCGEVRVIGIRQETDAEEAARESWEADKERAEYERLRAKFEKPKDPTAM